MAEADATELNNAAKRYWSEQAHMPGGVIKEADYAAHLKGLRPELAGIKIVDCDTHFTEPPDIFTSRAPAHLKDKVPYQAVADGITRWFVEGQDYGIVGGNVIRQDPSRHGNWKAVKNAILPAGTK